MKLQITDLYKSIGLIVAITHNDETIKFNIKNFKREQFKDKDNFLELNLYLSTYNETEQNKIFAIYKDILYSFTNIWDMEELQFKLKKQIAQLMFLLDYDRLEIWLHVNNIVKIPEDIKKEYVENIDKQTRRELTYLKDDYNRLIALVVLIKAFIPIWGAYIGLNKKYVGTHFKEYEAYKLVDFSKIEAINKLNIYITNVLNTSSDKEKSDIKSILAGISSMDVPEWILSAVLVKRLPTVELDANTNLMARVYKYIISKAKPLSNNSQPIIDKNVTGEAYNSDEKSRLSIVETYRAKEQLSGGDIEELENAVNDSYQVAYKLCGKISKEDIDYSLDLAINNIKHITEAQIILLQWVIKPIISPMSILYLKRPTVIRLLAVCRILLLQMDYRYLALLATAKIIPVEDPVISLGSTDSRSKITPGLLEELDILFPYKKIIGGQKTGLKEINVALKAVEILVEKFMLNIYEASDIELYRSLFPNNIGNQIPVFSDLRIILIKFIIDITKRFQRS
jgi:hypothetical protein